MDRLILNIFIIFNMPLEHDLKSIEVNIIINKQVTENSPLLYSVNVT